MKKQIEELNAQIAEKNDAYRAHLLTLPETLGEEAGQRSAKMEDGRVIMFAEISAMNKRKLMLQKAHEDDLEHRAITAEMNTNNGKSGAEFRTSLEKNDIDVEDQPIYRGLHAVGQQIVDMWNNGNHPGSSRGKAAHRRLDMMNNRRHVIAEKYNSRADYPTQQESVVSAGGIFLETERSFELMTHGFNNGVLAAGCRRMSMGGKVAMHEIYGFFEKSRKDADRYGALRFVPVDELEEAVRQKMEFENLFKIQPRKLGAGFNMSEELAQDAPMVESIIMDLFKKSWARDLDWYIWNANGGKEPGVGVTNAQARYDIDAETGQTANTLWNSNILKMLMHMPARSYPNAQFFYNQFLLEQLHGLFYPTGATGELSRLFRPAETPTGVATLGGRPATPIEHVAPVGRAGDIALIDLDQVLITDKGGMRTGSSVEIEWWAGQKSVKLITSLDIQPIYKDKVQVFNDEVGEEKYVSPYIFLKERKTPAP